MRINYDDDLLDVMDKVNKALEAHGLRFVDDGEEHEGWVEYEVVSAGVDLAAVAAKREACAMGADRITKDLWPAAEVLQPTPEDMRRAVRNRVAAEVEAMGDVIPCEHLEEIAARIRARA